MTFHKRTIAAAVLATTAFAAPLPATAADFGAPRVVPGTAYAPAPVSNACYAVFHRHRNATGRSLQRVGPERVAVIRDLRYHNGASLNNRVQSITTGPGAHIVLYSGRGFRHVLQEAGPGSEINLLLPSVDSYELNCIPGYYQPPVYAPAPRPLYK